MKDKNQIVSNWLPRYTGVPIEEFGEHVLLTNFGGYLDHFARIMQVDVRGRRDFSRHDRHARGDERFARHSAVLVLRKDRVQHRVRYLVRDLVGMTLGDRLGREDVSLRCCHVCGFSD